MGQLFSSLALAQGNETALALAGVLGLAIAYVLLNSLR